MKLIHRFSMLLLIAGLALLAACDLGTPPTPTPVPTPPATMPPPVPPPAPPTAPPSASPSGVPATPDPTQPVIVYEKSGGIAGVRAVLEIYSNDTARWSPSRGTTVTVQLPLDTVEGLRTDFDTARFFGLADEYDNRNVADDFYYTITYRANGQTKTVRAAAAGGQDLTPQALRDLIARLQRLATEAANVTPGPVAPAPATSTPAAPPGPTETAPPAPASVTPAATMPPGPASPTPAPTGGTGPAFTQIVYQRSGGFAGVNEVLEIGANRVAQFSSRGQAGGTATLTAAQLDSLAAQLEAARFFDLQERYDSGTVSDDFYHTITISRGGQTRTVTVAEIGGQGLTPAPLTALIATLQGLAADLRALPTPTAPAAPPGPSPTVGATEGSDLVAYRVQGGIAGLDTGMYIDRRGGVRFTSRGADTGTAQIGPDDLRALVERINGSGFFDLQGRYAPPALPADNQTITVTFNYGGRSKTVTVESGADVPPNLTPILARLRELQAQLQPK